MLNMHPSPRKEGTNDEKKRKEREKSVVIGLLVSGVSRLGLGNGRAEWDVYVFLCLAPRLSAHTRYASTSTYTFSPRTGRVMRHTVNAIDPAPHEAVFGALRSSLSKLSLAGSGSGDAQKLALFNYEKGEILLAAPLTHERGPEALECKAGDAVSTNDAKVISENKGDVWREMRRGFWKRRREWALG